MANRPKTNDESEVSGKNRIMILQPMVSCSADSAVTKLPASIQKRSGLIPDLKIYQQRLKNRMNPFFLL
ncbi:MAG: hypothetical protein Q8904_06090 [Bacteroidota bacterium]|nr:hypothetical protein [Bacteroidota bacterium]